MQVSDSVSSGQTIDRSGPAVAKLLANSGGHWAVSETAAISDDLDRIQGIVKLWTNHRKLDLILSTGGTGFSPRDVTPEVTQLVS